MSIACPLLIGGQYRELCAAHRLYPLKELYRPGAESAVRKDAP